MKRAVKVFFSLLGLLLLISCSESGVKESGKTTITILIEPDQGGGWRAIAGEFEKAHPGIQVQLKPRISEVGTKNNSFCPAKR
jgi:ABC-type glycerol-3-phosphate transport system substrate-binding protein